MLALKACTVTVLDASSRNTDCCDVRTDVSLTELPEEPRTPDCECTASRLDMLNTSFIKTNNVYISSRSVKILLSHHHDIPSLIVFTQCLVRFCFSASTEPSTPVL